MNKKKALNYLHSAAPIAAASDNQGLNSAAKVVRNFENANYSANNLKSLTKDLRQAFGSTK